MKQTSFVKRCIAFALALVLLVSQSGLGVVQTVHAASGVDTTIAGIIADNYDLSEAEKNLLKSGYLVSDSFNYNAPSDEDSLVSVDTENKKISAESKNGFVPVQAMIVLGEEIKETVTLTNGAGTYQYDGNAFSVKVVYELSTTVAAATQEALLGAAAILKQGVQNLVDVAAQSGNLYILEQAMPELVNLANTGVQTSFATFALSDACKAAIYALNNQMADNDGQLLLSTMIEEYEAGTQTGYLMTKGVDMQAEVADLVEKVTIISTALNTIYNNIEWLINGGYVSETLANQIKTLAKTCKTLADGLATVNADPWTAANSDNLVYADADYAKLDTLVAALGETTAVTVKETLKVAEATVQVNMAMYNVTYTVILNHYVDNQLVEGFKQTKTETLAEDATKDKMQTMLSALEDYLKVEDVYVDGKFDRTATEIPATLTEDLTITATYNPKNFNVTIAGETAAYPYGWQLTLPNHSDANKSYDYYLGDTYYAQGSVVTVTGNMTFTRSEGKAYTSGDLYGIIADNYANEKVAAILTSGAILGNEAINYRQPTEAELEKLVKLEGNVLTVQSYASSYAGLNWEPYAYVVDGAEKLFNGATKITLSGDFENVHVYYRLTMTNHTEADVKAILDLAAELAAEAEGQKSVMDRLASYKDQMGQLNRNMLNGLIGMIGGYAVSEGGQYSDALVAQMKATIQDIVANCCATDGSLKLNAVIAGYTDANNGGLLYYYQNADSIQEQVDYLSQKLEALLGDPQGKDLITTLLNDMGYGAYVDKLDDLNAKMAEINASLAPVNAAIDTTNAASLSKLVTALTMEGETATTECGSPYVQMGPVIRTADKYVTVEVKAVIGNKNTTASVTIRKNSALTQAQVDTLKAQINDFVNANINTAYYNDDFANGSELDALVNVALAQGKTYTYTWTAKEYIVKIDGEADQIVTIDNLTINLPAHTVAGYRYEYTIGGNTVNAGIYTFAEADLLNLFVNGELTITRVEKNETVEKLVNMVNTINADMGFEALTLVSENGVYTGINADITATDLMGLMMGLVMKSDYGYIGLNDEGFIYSTAEGLELSMQTLIDAIIADEDFGSDTIIALGENGHGKLLAASLQLGNSADEIVYNDLTFTINLTSVPDALVEYTKYIKAGSAYLGFQSGDGAMNFTVTLPDQAYAAYALALVATGNVEKNDINGMTQKVPVQFVYDYFTAITGSEMDMETFTNTLELMGFSKDLTKFNDYYNSAVGAYNKYTTVSVNEDKTTIELTTPGKASIDGLVALMGIDISAYEQFLGMLKEYDDDENIVINAAAKLGNVDKTYYALVIDAQADGLRNKVEAPTSYAALADETANLAGYSFVILTNNVEGDLTVSGTTVLDLNGFDVAGTIHATGKLIIIDSSMDTYNAGTVENVTGNATILAGNYNNDISALLNNGYYMDGTTVRNALYTISEDADGNLTFVLNGDVYEDPHVEGYFPDAKALAVDIASDILLNYFMTAKIGVGGYELIAIDVDDLVGLYAGDNRIANLAKQLIECVTIGEAGYENNAGFEGVVNLILADLLDFASITEALNNNTALATYSLTTAPWLIEIDHQEEENYATIDVGYNSELEKTVNVSLIVESKFNDNIAAMTEELSKIVVADETYAMVDIPTPTYSDKTLTVSGAGKAAMVIDMSENSNYVTVIGVVLGYGNADKAAAIAAALNDNDMAAMKEIIDNTSVEEIFTALKKLSRSTDFAAMAAAVGVTVDTAEAAELEAKFHVVLCAAGKVLEELDITGMDSKLGALYNEETGYYELTRENIFRDKEINVRSYSAIVELEATLLSLKVKLFGDEPECMWGDANHDNIVDTDDATLVELYFVGLAPESFCTIRTDVNADGVIDTDDATLIRQYWAGLIDVFPAENK